MTAPTRIEFPGWTVRFDANNWILEETVERVAKDGTKYTDEVIRGYYGHPAYCLRELQREKLSRLGKVALADVAKAIDESQALILKTVEEAFAAE